MLKIMVEKGESVLIDSCCRVELLLEFMATPHDTKATVELPVHILIACFGAHTLIALSVSHIFTMHAGDATGEGGARMNFQSGTSPSRPFCRERYSVCRNSRASDTGRHL